LGDERQAADARSLRRPPAWFGSPSSSRKEHPSSIFRISGRYPPFARRPGRMSAEPYRHNGRKSALHFHPARGRFLPKPRTRHYDWIAGSKRTLYALETCEDCGRWIRGNFYLNAYVGSVEKPPESMVQLAVLVPLLEYEGWSGQASGPTKGLLSSLPTFIDPKLKVVVRWLPGEPFGGGADSEEEHHDTMDSWYYLHTLLNVARLAALKQDGMMDLLVPSLEHAIKVAHHFDYRWPVFYRLRSLEVIKAKTKPGEGGEHDVAGLFAHVMLQAYELTKERRYLDEAEASAARIDGKGFRLLYQTNNTMMAATALLKLWRVTGNADYRDLEAVCLANVVAQLWIWNARYGFSKSYDTFMGVAPLRDAPYLASYEEHEFLGSAISYLKEAGPDIHPALNVLLPEYMKYLLHRARFYFCEELPFEALSSEPKEGRIGPELFVPLEDIYAGRKQAGAVGQEVYGAAAAFLLTTTAYVKSDGLPFRIRSEYPVLDFAVEDAPEGGRARIVLAGDPDFSCRLTIEGGEDHQPTMLDEAGGILVGEKSAGRTEYEVGGGGTYRLTWKMPASVEREEVLA
jgi:hypothetical protein